MPERCESCDAEFEPEWSWRLCRACLAAIGITGKSTEITDPPSNRSNRESDPEGDPPGEADREGESKR